MVISLTFNNCSSKDIFAIYISATSLILGLLSTLLKKRPTIIPAIEAAIIQINISASNFLAIYIYTMDDNKAENKLI